MASSKMTIQDNKFSEFVNAFQPTDGSARGAAVSRNIGDASADSFRTPLPLRGESPVQSSINNDAAKPLHEISSPIRAEEVASLNDVAVVRGTGSAARYIHLTQGKRAIVDDDLYESLSKYKWFFKRGYATRNIRIGRERKTLPMHREVLDTPAGLHTDHINGDTLDNRRENLRICTASENLRNRGAQRDNKSGFKGVSWHKRDRVWRAQVQCLGKLFHLGLYKTKEEAALAYNKAAIELHGEFAKLNVIHANGAE